MYFQTVLDFHVRFNVFAISIDISYVLIVTYINNAQDS